MKHWSLSEGLSNSHSIPGGCSIAACLLFVILGGSQDIFAHPGGTNKQGCHNDKEKGECHCHRDEQDRKLSPPVISPNKCGKLSSGPNFPPPYEADFVAKFCLARKGRLEVPVKRGRVDCLTKIHAIEGDFAPKWEEAFKQSQHYAIETDRKAGILLILENENDALYIKKLCKQIAEKQVSIDVFAIGIGYAEIGESVPCPDLSGDGGTVLEIQA